MLLANVLTYGTCRLPESTIKEKNRDQSLIRLHCEGLKKTDQTAGEPCYVVTAIDQDDLCLSSSVLKNNVFLAHSKEANNTELAPDFVGVSS